MEAMELDYPFFRVENYALIPDSGGKGKHRAVLASRRATVFSRMASPSPPTGPLPHRTTRPVRRRPGPPCPHERDGETIVVGSKAGLELKKGDLLIMRTGGGGGYGDASERDARLEAEDLEEGLITRAAE